MAYAEMTVESIQRRRQLERKQKRNLNICSCGEKEMGTRAAVKTWFDAVQVHIASSTSLHAMPHVPLCASQFVDNSLTFQKWLVLWCTCCTTGSDPAPIVH